MYNKTQNQINYNLAHQPLRNVKTNFSQSQPNDSSLQQSPIAPDSRDQSDQSPQPFIYPSSLQPINPKKMCKSLNLKDQVTALLTKLKQWLQQLSLTQNFSHQISEQLDPIIQQLAHPEDQSQFSGWSQKIQYAHDKKSFNSLYLKDSQIANLQSIKIVEPNFKYRSIILQEEASRITLLNEGEKNIVRLFFKRYYRLIQNCIMRINRCTGQKKLKFLVETTMRNIFSETLRVSYDLKIVQLKLLEKKQIKEDFSRFLNTNLLKSRLEILINQRGGVKSSFNLLKRLYFESSTRDCELVSKMFDKIVKLSSIYQKNKRSQLRQSTYAWRQLVFQNKISQTVALTEVVRHHIHSMLASLINMGSCKEQFSSHWRFVIQNHMNLIIEQLFHGQQCLFISLQDILKERLIQKEKHVSVIDFLEEQQQFSSNSHRSQIYRQHPFLAQFTLEELKNCIISGEIYRCDKLSNSLLLLPMKPLPGIIFASLLTNNQPRSQTDFTKIPMSLSSFRLLLRVAEVITPLLEDLSCTCKRVQNNWQQVQNNSYEQLLFKEYLKFDIFSKNSINFEGHLSIQNQSESQITVNSNRLQMPSEIVKTVLDRFRINNLMIYHCKNLQQIQDQPCIVYGDRELAKVQTYIINSIYKQLVNSGKNVLVISRNGKTYNILALRKQSQYIGLIHYTCQNMQKVDPYIISECLVPLILKYQGTINCSLCTVSFTISTLMQKELKSQQCQPNTLKTLNIQQIADILSCHTLTQLQALCLKLTSSVGNFFHKIIYRLDLSDISQYYSLQNNLLIHYKIKANQIISHQQMFVEDYNSLNNCSTFAQITFSQPCFSNPQLHIYQHQNAYPFRMIGLPIICEGQLFGYFLLGHYLISEVNNQKIINYFKSFVSYLCLNKQIFTAKKLDDQSLRQESISYKPKDSQLNQKIYKAIIQSNRNGKLIQKIESFAETLQKHQILASGKTQMHIFNLDTHKNTIKFIYSSDSLINKQSLHLSQQISNILKNTDKIVTHQKIYANQLRLLKHNTNRTVRPLKAHQLQPTKIFIPQINHLLKTQLLAIVKSKFQLQGWAANQNSTILNDIISNFHTKNHDQNKMYLVLYLGTKPQKSNRFFLVLQQQVLSPNQKDILSSQTIQIIHQNLTQIIKQSLYLQPNNFQKFRSIKKLNHIVRRGHSVQRSISQFYQKTIFNRFKIQLMFKKVSSLIGSTKSNKYYTQLRYAFLNIKKIKLKLDSKIHIFSQILAFALKNASKKQLIRHGFYSIYNWIYVPITYSKIRGCSKLFQYTSKILCLIYKKSLQQFAKISKLRYLNKKIVKINSACRIYRTIQILNKRQNIQYFFNQIFKIFNQYVSNFQLINQQCAKTNFNSKHQFITFFNERFTTLIQHLNFGSISTIQIMTAQKLVGRYIIYKLGAQKQLVQIQTQTLGNTQMQNDKSLIFLPIPVTFNGQISPQFIIYRVTGKIDSAIPLQKSILHKVIIEGLLPCYSRYLKTKIQNANKVCQVLMIIFCKQLWNRSTGTAQNIYAFSAMKIQSQCQKLRAMSCLKSIKQKQRIQELKIVRNAINQQSKIYYHLQYYCNALSNALSGANSNYSEQQKQVLGKYGELITRQQLKQIRQSNAILQQEEQKQLLQYQIKSKIFATTKITTFYQQKQNIQLQKISRQYLSQVSYKKQNQCPNDCHLQKIYVDKKLELTAIKQKISKQQKKVYSQAIRGLWIIFKRLLRKQEHRNKKKFFYNLSSLSVFHKIY